MVMLRIGKAKISENNACCGVAVERQTGGTDPGGFNALLASRFVQHRDVVIGLTPEMLGPMLKTWLDDNLPGIVERLVSAEIERVARGE
jgi:uncharacterized protein